MKRKNVEMMTKMTTMMMLMVMADSQRKAT